MNNNELNNQNNVDNQATGVFNNLNSEPVSNNQLNNSALDDQLFTDTSLNNFGQTLNTNQTPVNSGLTNNLNQAPINNGVQQGMDLAGQSLQSENVNTIFDNTASINTQTPVNNIEETPKATEPVKEEPKVEVKEKKSKGPVALIVLLLIAILGLAGYIVYDKFLSKDTKEPETKEEETALKEVKDKALIEQLRSELVAKNTNGTGGLVKGQYHNYKITSSDANNKELLLFNILKYTEENNLKIGDAKSTITTESGIQRNVYVTITKSFITSYMQNKYNTNLDYTYKASKQYDSVGVIGYLEVLTDDENYYIVSIPGGDGSYYLNTKLVKAEEDNDNIYIYDKAVYSTLGIGARRSFDSLDTSDYYDNTKNEYIPDKILIECLEDTTTPDPSDMKKIATCPFEGSISDVTSDSMSKYAFEKMSNKMKTYKHTFKKIDGNYFWVSSEVVE